MTNAFEKFEIFQLSKYVRRRVKAAAFVPAVRNGRVLVHMYERVDASKARKLRAEFERRRVHVNIA